MFLCPKCSNHSLKISSSIELPYDSRSDEIALQIIKCSRCSYEGVAVYEESRRGGFDSETINHTGYDLPAEDLKSLKALIAKCPKPKETGCQCKSHQKLGIKNEYGRWIGIEQLNYGKHFVMKLRN